MILDTNAVSAAAEEQPAIVEILASAQLIALPVVVIGEYRLGIEQSRRKVEHQRWLESLIADCLVLEVSEQTTRHYAALGMELKSIGRPIPTNDLWIAALCSQHGLPILSRDKHFDAVPGIQRLNW